MRDGTWDAGANRWSFADGQGKTKFAIDGNSSGVVGFVQVVGTSAALSSGTGTIAISSQECGEIKFEDIIVATPGTAFPTVSTGSGPNIAWVRATDDGLVNFGLFGSIGVMNWRIVAIKGDRYLTSP